MNKDLHNNINQTLVLPHAAIDSETVTNSVVLDTEAFLSNEFIVAFGTITDGVYTVTIQEGDEDDLSDAANASSDDILATTANLTVIDTDDDKSVRLGYIGYKRYIRLSITSATVTTGVDSVVGIAVQSNAKFQPTVDVKN